MRLVPNDLLAYSVLVLIALISSTSEEAAFSPLNKRSFSFVFYGVIKFLMSNDSSSLDRLSVVSATGLRRLSSAVCLSTIESPFS